MVTIETVLPAWAARGSETASEASAANSVFEQTGEDLLARAFLHETDHLNGSLYINHISALKRDLIRRKIRKLQKSDEWS